MVSARPGFEVLSPPLQPALPLHKNGITGGRLTSRELFPILLISPAPGAGSCSRSSARARWYGGMGIARPDHFQKTCNLATLFTVLPLSMLKKIKYC